MPDVGTTASVPAAVPSVRHSAAMFAPTYATNQTRPSKAVQPDGLEPSTPGRRSPSGTVPRAVPSEVQGSVPVADVLKPKYTRGPTPSRKPMDELEAPGVRSATREMLVPSQ